ncbi:putative p450 heme-thiolate protein [Mycobacterium avium subsp. avium 2285 (R)]|nr:putative p450 heme-thiolate protein [Mycobacterium avium subsp. avium 2285 (R)]
MHGLPRAYFAVQARRGDPLARLLRSGTTGEDRYALMEQIRARGPLMRAPFVWASVDHAVCRQVLRDKRFGVTSPTEMELPRPVRALIARTDPGVANPVAPPAMVIVDPPDHTRYRQLVAQSFTPRAIEALNTRVAQVTMELIERIAATPQPDLIADFATRLPVAIIAEILGMPPDSYPRMLAWAAAAPRCWTSASTGRPTATPSPGCAASTSTCSRTSTSCAPTRTATIRSAGWPPTGR